MNYQQWSQHKVFISLSMAALLLAGCGAAQVAPTIPPTSIPATPTPTPPTPTPPSPTSTPTPPPPTPTPTPPPPTPTPTPSLGDKRILYILQEHFNKDEYGLPRKILGQKGGSGILASSSLDTVTAYEGAAKVSPSILLSDVRAADYDAIVFVGGYPYDDNDPQAHRIAQEAVAEGKVVAGICNGVIALAKAGVLKGKRVTALVYHPASALEQEGAILTDATVERDGLIITANGPEASREFGEAIAAALEE